MSAGAAGDAAPGRLERIRRGLRRTREGFVGRLAALFEEGAAAPDAWRDELETLLIEADLGPGTAERILRRIEERTSGAAPTREAVHEAARVVLKEMLRGSERRPGAENGRRPHVTLVVGVNGGGKTTTVGKLAYRLRRAGRSVLLCAADTFRAGAGEQLKIWAERIGAASIGQGGGADPSAVVHDAATAALSRRTDALIVDTAGRLHTQDPLMRELEKMCRVVGRIIDGAPHEVLLVLDATTGQNGLNQAREFLSAARVTGLVLTKVDGTARGGVAIRIVQELGIPLRYVGVGEDPEDLVAFDADEFVDGLLSSAA